jgi:L-asparagine oxygenase
LGIAAILGEPLSYRAEKSGVLVQHVYPVESQKNAPSNESSASTLSLHTEIALSVENLSNPARIDSPDFVLLLCLRADPNRRAATLIAAVDDLCAHLSGSELSTLQDARFELRAPYSFTPAHVEQPWLGPVRILDDTNGKRVAAFDLACGCRGMDREAQKALEQLKVAATSMAATTQVYLESGDLLILDNQRCAHGRTSFPAGFDGRDRWLQRMYVRRSLEGMHPVQPGFRVF